MPNASLPLSPPDLLPTMPARRPLAETKRTSIVFPARKQSRSAARIWGLAPSRRTFRRAEFRLLFLCGRGQPPEASPPPLPFLNGEQESKTGVDILSQRFYGRWWWYPGLGEEEVGSVCVEIGSRWSEGAVPILGRFVPVSAS